MKTEYSLSIFSVGRYMNMSAHGQWWQGSAFDDTSCIEQPLPLLCTAQRRKQGCSLQKPVNSWLCPEGQPHSSSTHAPGQPSSEVKPHLEAVVSRVSEHSLLLTAAVWPCSCSLPCASSAVLQSALPGASTGNQLGWNGLQLTAKPALTLTFMRKRSGNVSLGSPVGHSHFSISQQVSPTCLPILLN